MQCILCFPHGLVRLLDGGPEILDFAFGYVGPPDEVLDGILDDVVPWDGRN